MMSEFSISKAAKIYATLALMIFASLGCNVTSAAEQERPRRFIYNSDGGNIFIYKNPPMTPEDVYAYVDEVADTQVTTFFICPNYGMPLLYPSKVTEMVGSLMTDEQWEDVKRIAPERKGTKERGLTNLRALVDAGHDPIGLVVDRAREKNLEIFVTLRLNEVHDVQNPDSLIVSKFWRDHPEWRVGKPGDEIMPTFKEIIGGRADKPVNPIVASWFPGALNFAVPEVRALRLAELRECCERYPLDGIDLDFQRFPIFFPQDEGSKHVATMTDWIREVREMTREVGKKRGRPLKLSARILAKPEQNLAIGLDPATWAQQGLVDFLVVSHYLKNDFPLPIDKFRKLVPDNMPIYSSIEVEPYADNFRKIARQLWKNGTDGILLFNFFTSRESGREPLFELLNELGDPTTIKATESK
ncbi:MAG: hypothetical protein GXP26_14190 [Planctomycetes bacterium]|nr:hypothetical protein [Planctomycetota bacterium]